MINFSIDPNFSAYISEACLMVCIKKTLAIQSIDISNIELSIVITTNEYIQKLNMKYRGIDEPTDVLSFQVDLIERCKSPFLLGDIIISFEKAALQASMHQYSVTREIQLLLVHGLLHLLGYDHIEQSDKKQMWKMQRQILSNCKSP